MMNFLSCQIVSFEEYFRCQANGRFADPTNCKQGRYFECVYFGQCEFGRSLQSIII